MHCITFRELLTSLWDFASLHSQIHPKILQKLIGQVDKTNDEFSES